MAESSTSSTSSYFPVEFNCPVSDWTVVLGVITVLSWIAIIILIFLLCRLKQTVKKDYDNSPPKGISFRHRPDEEVDGNTFSLQRRNVDEQDERRKYKRLETTVKPEISSLPLLRSCSSMCSLETNESLLDYSLVPWNIEMKYLEIKESLGRGAFGEVNSAYLTDVDKSKRKVAVKQLRDDVALRTNEVENFLSEMNIVKTLTNKVHFVHLIGSSSAPNGNLCLVFELEENGNLLDLLRNSRNLETSMTSQMIPTTTDGSCNRNIIITKELMTDFSIQVACGMVFLASAGIVHRDLAARNVLVSKDLTLRISDFGLARRLEYSQEFYDGQKGDGPGRRFPFKWMAPESLNRLVFSTMSDVWSFGIFLWEVQTLGGRPYESISELNQLISFLKSGRRLEQPMDCTKKFYGVMRRCWEYESDHRAEFDDILDHLQWILTEKHY